MLTQDDISDKVIIRTWGKNAQGQSVPVYQIDFRVKGQGPVRVTVPVEGFDAQKTLGLMRAEGQKLLDLIEGKP